MIDSSLHSNAYVQDILDQPTALHNTLKTLTEIDISAFRPITSQLSSGRLRRIVLTGMGSSFHALHPIFITLIERNFSAQMIETSELIHYAVNLIEPSTLIVAVSQSGCSAEIIQLLDKVQGKATLIGITNSSDSPLATRANAVLLTKAGVESTVSCKTYVATLAALAVLARILTGQETSSTLAELQRAPELVELYLSHWETHVETVFEIVKGVQSLMLAGRGTSLAATGTGGLIIKEAAHFPAEGMSSAAFRHGPLEMISPKIFVLVCEGIGIARELNAKLVQDIKNIGGRSELVGMDGKQNIYKLPIVPNSCLPIMEILPVQLTSVALAIQNNHVPGQFERATKTTVVE